MHSKIQDFISALLINMSEEEKSIFLTEGRKSVGYMALYRIYIDSKSNKSLLKNLAEFKVGKTAEAFNDLNSQLYKKLLLFLAEIDKQNDEDINILTSIIVMVNVLIKRKLFNQASVELMRAYRILKNLEVNEFNYHLYLQYLNLVLILQTRPFKSSSSKKLLKDFEEIETIDWLNRLSLFAAKNIRKPEDIDGVDFNKNIFFNLLGNYYIERENYKVFSEWVGENIALKMNSFFKEFKSNKKLDDTIKSVKILSILEAIYAGYKLNDKSIVDEYANILKAEVFHTKDSNYQTFAFLLLHIHDIQFRMKIESKIPIAEYYFETKYKDLQFFTELELDSLAVRVELNKALVYFYNKDFKKAQALFNSFETKKIKNPELRYYIRFYEMLSYLSHSLENFEIDNLDQKIKYLNELKFKKSVYSKELLKLIVNNPATYLLNKLIPEFSEKYKPSLFFDEIIQNWLLNLKNS